MGMSRTWRHTRAAVFALLLCLLGEWCHLAAPAQAAQHSISSVRIYKSRGFMYAEAWFEDFGPGTSRVSVWIDAYRATNGAFLASYGRRDATSSCDRPGARCSMLLKTSVQSVWSECYVARTLSIAPGGGRVAASDPPRELFCA